MTMQDVNISPYFDIYVGILHDSYRHILNQLHKDIQRVYTRDTSFISFSVYVNFKLNMASDLIWLSDLAIVVILV